MDWIDPTKKMPEDKAEVIVLFEGRQYHATYDASTEKFLLPEGKFILITDEFHWKPAGKKEV